MPAQKKYSIGTAHGWRSSCCFTALLVASFFIALFPMYYIMGLPVQALLLTIIVSVGIPFSFMIFEPVIFIWALVLIIGGGYPTHITVLFCILFVIWALRYTFFAAVILPDLFRKRKTRTAHSAEEEEKQ